MKRKSLSDALKTRIRKSGKTLRGLANESGVSHPVILRFMTGERDIRLKTAEKLAVALDLGLEEMNQ